MASRSIHAVEVVVGGLARRADALVARVEVDVLVELGPDVVDVELAEREDDVAAVGLDLELALLRVCLLYTSDAADE